LHYYGLIHLIGKEELGKGKGCKVMGRIGKDWTELGFFWGPIKEWK